MIKVYPNMDHKPKKCHYTAREWKMIIVSALLLGACAGYLGGLVIGIDNGIKIGSETAIVD